MKKNQIEAQSIHKEFTKCNIMFLSFEFKLWKTKRIELKKTKIILNFFFLAMSNKTKIPIHLRGSI